MYDSNYYLHVIIVVVLISILSNDPLAPTVTAPPLPRYMAAQMLQQDFPPSYEAACAPKPSTTPADMTHES